MSGSGNTTSSGGPGGLGISGSAGTSSPVLTLAHAGEGSPEWVARLLRMPLGERSQLVQLQEEVNRKRCDRLLQRRRRRRRQCLGVTHILTNHEQNVISIWPSELRQTSSLQHERVAFLSAAFAETEDCRAARQNKRLDGTGQLRRVHGSDRSNGNGPAAVCNCTGD